MFHWLVDEPEWIIQYAIRDFRRALRAIAEEKIAVLPMSRVWSELAISSPKASGSPDPAPPR